MPSAKPQVLHFLLLPEFSVMGFVSVIEPLRVANRFRPGSYVWHILSADGAPVVASNGMSINADAACSQVRATELLFVVAGFNPLAHASRALLAWLRTQRKLGTVLGAIDSGAFLLARAGLLATQPFTVHWEAAAAFCEHFPQLRPTEELFEIGADTITCAGGTAGIDMVLALIRQRHGRELAAQVSEQFVLGRIRSPSDHQRTQIATRYGLHNRKAIHAIDLMQRHLESPLTAAELAQRVHVTPRQLERIFMAQLQDSPRHFYLRLRLERALELLQQTDLSVTEVGLGCGFASLASFSRAFRAHTGHSPRSVRLRAP